MRHNLAIATNDEVFTEEQDIVRDTRTIPTKDKSENSDNILCGDVRLLLKSIPANKVDCIITSPPYFQQRGYTGISVSTGQERVLEDYLESLYEVFAEMLRVLKPRGNIFYNLGDKIDKNKGAMLVPYRFALGVLDKHPQLSLVNDITWVKKNPTPRQFDRRLVSATEPFFHFVKSKEYYYEPSNYFSQEREINNSPSDKLGMRYFDLIDGSDLSAAEKEQARAAIKKAIAEVQANKISGFRMKIRGIHAPAFGGQDGGRNSQMRNQGFTVIKINGAKLKKDYIEMAVESLRYDIKHPAVFPLRLIEELIGLSCPLGGLVLDPYCGSGTTLVAARKKGCHYLGIDISPEYCTLAQRRINEL